MFVSPAFAQGAPGGLGQFDMLLPLLLMLIIMYFFLFRPQQQKMKDCNAKAADKKGDERKKFMSDCLAGKSTKAKAPTAQQKKMTDCNKAADAKAIKGDARQKFMSDCLKG